MIESLLFWRKLNRPSAATSFQCRLFWGWLIFLVALFLAVPVVRAASSVDQLEQFVGTVQTATGSFTQKQLDESGQDADQTTYGLFSFERPGRFRWETTRPHEQLIISDGQILLQYDPDLAQIIERDVDASVGASPAAILFGAGELTDAFDLTPQPDAGGLQWLEARPLTADAGFSHVDIGFDQNIPRQIILHDAFGQITQIELADIQTNMTLAPDTFRLETPQDVDRVKM